MYASMDGIEPGTRGSPSEALFSNKGAFSASLLLFGGMLADLDMEAR